jgi:hypothetical protein
MDGHLRGHLHHVDSIGPDDGYFERVLQLPRCQDMIKTMHRFR